MNSVDFIPVGVYEPFSILSLSAQEVEPGGRKPFWCVLGNVMI